MRVTGEFRSFEKVLYINFPVKCKLAQAGPEAELVTRLEVFGEAVGIEADGLPAVG